MLRKIYRLFDGDAVSLRQVITILFAASIIFNLRALTHQPLFTHDGYFHNLFIVNLAEAFRNGHFYPRWLSGMDGGCGEASLFFYPPLAYFFALPFYILTGNAGWAFTLLSIPITWLAGLAMYRYLREFVLPGDALIGAVLYLFLPTREATFYLGGVMSEYVAYTAVPLLLLSLRRLFHGEGRYVFLLVASMSFTLLSSVSMTTILSLFIPLYAIYEWQNTRPSRQELRIIFIRLVGAGMLAIPLSATLLVPFYTEFRNVHLGNHYPLLDPAKEFLLLLSPFWMLAWYLTFSLVIYFLLKLRRAPLEPSLRRQTRFLGILLCYLIFLMTPLSLPLWLHFPPLQAIQSPGRFGFCLAFIWGVLVAIYVAHFRGGSMKNIRAAWIIFAVLPFSYNTTDNFSHKILREYSVRPFHEFLPKDVEITRWTVSKNIIEAAADCQQKAQVLEGKATVGIIGWKPYSLGFSIDADTPASIRLGQFYYPHWKVTEGVATISTDATTGQLTLAVPPGKQTIHLAFVHPGIIGVANTISLISWSIMLIFLWKSRHFFRPDFPSQSTPST